jgi:hypothetical protein
MRSQPHNVAESRAALVASVSGSDSRVAPHFNEWRIAELEGKVASLEKRSLAASDATLAETPRRPGHGEEFKEAFSKRLAQQKNEPTESAWAEKATTLLRTDIQDIATQSGFRLLSIDCRTTLCLARVEWNSPGEASREFARLAHGGYRANCTKSVVVDETPSSGGSIGASVLFDCEEWRAGGEQELPPSAPTAPG